MVPFVFGMVGKDIATCWWLVADVIPSVARDLLFRRAWLGHIPGRESGITQISQISQKLQKSGNAFLKRSLPLFDQWSQGLFSVIRGLRGTALPGKSHRRKKGDRAGLLRGEKKAATTFG
jgi:hypothetical protein